MIKEIKDKIRPGITDAEIKRDGIYYSFYVLMLESEIECKQPLFADFFDPEDETNMDHKVDVMERLYRDESVSEEEIFEVLGLGGKAEDGVSELVKW